MLEFRLARATAAATFVLLVIGGMVHATGSSLACPDWPLCYGQFFPAMEGGVLYEHGHRLVALAVSVLTVALAVAVWRRRRETAVRVGSLARGGAGALPGLAGRAHRDLEAAARRLVGPPRHLDGLLLAARLALLAPRAPVPGRGRDGPRPGASARWPALPHSACTSRSSSARWCATPAPGSPAARAWCSARAPPGRSVARPSSSPSTASPAWPWRSSWSPPASRRSAPDRSRARRAALLAPAVVVVQILLGAWTVWSLIAVPVVSLHLGRGRPAPRRLPPPLPPPRSRPAAPARRRGPRSRTRTRSGVRGDPEPEPRRPRAPPSPPSRPSAASATSSRSPSRASPAWWSRPPPPAIWLAPGAALGAARRRRPALHRHGGGRRQRPQQLPGA